MLKQLMALFVNGAALIAPEQQPQFDACLAGMAAHEHTKDLMNAPMMSQDSFWPASDDWRAAFRPYNVVDGILYIPVRGLLMHDFPWQFLNYATGYTYIQKAIERGQGDGNVKGIALVIHSPGGMVAGCFDLVERIEKIENRKPIRAFAHEGAYSAAYAIAAVADHIVVSRTGGVGSIGVVTSHVDLSKAMDEAGVKITFVHAGKYKVAGNPYEALDDETKARMQARVDSHYEIFVASVARNRGMDEQAVRGTEALTYTAKEAVSNGLADSIGPLDDAVAAFAADLSANEGDEQMKEFTKEQLDAARAEGFDAGKAEGLATGKAEGVKEERTRVSAILASDEGKKRPKAALSAALKTDMSTDAATAFLADLAEETAPAATAPTTTNDSASDTKQKFDESMSKDAPNLGAGGGKKDEANADDASNVVSLASSFGIPGLRKRD